MKLNDKAYTTYKQTVRGNRTITKSEAAKKLTRNVILAREYFPELIKKNVLGITYVYGNLHIKVRGKTIVSIENYKGGCNHIDIPGSRRRELSIQLGIW